MENNNELYVKSVKDFFNKIKEYGEREEYYYAPKDIYINCFDGIEHPYGISGCKEYIKVNEIIDANRNNELVEKILNDKELMLMAIDEYPDLAKYIGYDLKKDLNFLNRALSTSLKDYNQLDIYKDIKELRLSLVQSFDNNFESKEEDRNDLEVIDSLFNGTHNNKEEQKQEPNIGKLDLASKIAEIAKKRQEDKLERTNRMRI